MKKFNSHFHQRKSIRLKGYDYSRAGLYFITMCCKNRAPLFGKIVVEADPSVGVDPSVRVDLRVYPNPTPPAYPQMQLNDAGKMIEKWYHELENKFPDIKCHEMIIMPDHFHCIVETVGAVAADLRVRPNDVPSINDVPSKNNVIKNEHTGSSLQHVVQWFKTMTTNEYIRGVKNDGWKPFDGKLWQRNYYEHIIRNELAYYNITNYILNNPKKWAEAQLYNS